MRVLDIRYRHRGVADSVIDYRIHRYRHRVFGQNLHVHTSLDIASDLPEHIRLWQLQTVLHQERLIWTIWT